MRRGLTFLVKLYQYTFGLLLPPSCRFYPSCSEYATEALRIHPIHYAIWLIIKRLLKCQPFSQGGLDPVPPRSSSC